MFSIWIIGVRFLWKFSLFANALSTNGFIENLFVASICMIYNFPHVFQLVNFSGFGQ